MDVSWIHITGPALLLDTTAADPGLDLRTSGAASGPGDTQFYATYSLESLYDKRLVRRLHRAGEGAPPPASPKDSVPARGITAARWT